MVQARGLLSGRVFLQTRGVRRKAGRYGMAWKKRLKRGNVEVLKKRSNTEGASNSGLLLGLMHSCFVLPDSILPPFPFFFGAPSCTKEGKELRFFFYFVRPQPRLS